MQGTFCTGNGLFCSVWQASVLECSSQIGTFPSGSAYLSIKIFSFFSYLRPVISSCKLWLCSKKGHSITFVFCIGTFILVLFYCLFYTSTSIVNICLQFSTWYSVRFIKCTNVIQTHFILFYSLPLLASLSFPLNKKSDWWVSIFYFPPSIYVVAENCQVLIQFRHCLEFN